MKAADANSIARTHGLEVLRSALDAPAASPRVVLTLQEFLAGYESPDYLIDGVMRRRYFYSCTALTGAGKTAIALLIAVLASNRNRRSYLGSHEIEHVRVVYIACENPDDVRARVIGMASKMNFSEDDLDLLIIEKVTNLENNIDRIRKEAAAFGDVGLVIIDTSASMFSGDDENSNPQMIAHAKTQRRLCDLPGRPTVLALCHPAKSVSNSEQLLPRGGGGYLNETDGNFTAWAHGDRLTTLHWTGKFRGPDFDPIVFRLPSITTARLVDTKGRLLPTVMAEVVTDAQVDAAEEKAISRDNLLLIAMLKRPDGSLAQWAEDCEWYLPGAAPGEPPQPYKSQAQRVMDRLQKDHLVTKDGRSFILSTSGKTTALAASRAGS